MQEFGDICTVDFACLCLHKTLRVGPRARLFSPPVAGDAHHSYALELSCLSAPQPFGPLSASRATTGECFFRLDDIVSYDMLCPVCTYGRSRAFVLTLLAGIGFV